MDGDAFSVLLEGINISSDEKKLLKERLESLRAKSTTETPFPEHERDLNENSQSSVGEPTTKIHFPEQDKSLTEYSQASVGKPTSETTFQTVFEELCSKKFKSDTVNACRRLSVNELVDTDHNMRYLGRWFKL